MRIAKVPLRAAEFMVTGAQGGKYPRVDVRPRED